MAVYPIICLIVNTIAPFIPSGAVRCHAPNHIAEPGGTRLSRPRHPAGSHGARGREGDCFQDWRAKYPRRPRRVASERGSVPCPSPCRPTASRAEGGAGTARAGPTDATSASLPARPPIDTLSLKPRSGDLIPISIPGLRRRGRLRRRRRWACGRRRPSPCRCGRANRSPRRRPSPRTASSCRGGGSSADTRTA